MKILIKNGHVVDPANNIDGIYDILVENSTIMEVGRDIKTNIAPTADMLIDATGKFVMPGLVDMHVHLREPGREDKETILSGTRAAAKGGVTSVLAMPNTTPAIDSAEHIQLLKNIIQHSAQVHSVRELQDTQISFFNGINVFMASAITKGRQGKELVDIAVMKKEGAVAISDDGVSVDDDVVMLEAFKAAKKENILVICHCEDKSLANNGVVNLGFISTILGLRGLSKESEYKRVKRDIELAIEAQAAVHIAHVSCKESVELIAEAKKKGLVITAETAPHYFSLSEESLSGYDTNMKMNPPLRSKEDVAEIKQALKDGIIDCIASDHAPHTENEKEIEFERAEFGVIGLETELAVSITELVEQKILNWPDLVRKMSLNPAKVLGLNRGTLGVDCIADLIIVDVKQDWKVSKDCFISKSKNSAFLGRHLRGVVEYTICGGKVVYKWNS